MTETSIICSSHIFPPDFDGIPEYPYTTLPIAKSEGWRTTQDRLFSRDGQDIWVCPECIERLRIHYHADRHRYLEDEARRHFRRVADLDTDYHFKLYDLTMENIRRREKIERHYRKRLESID